jgi:hypothetical protein
MNMEDYFKKNAEKLKETYELFRSTNFGRNLNLPKWSISNYNMFKKLPLTDPKKVDLERLFIPGDGLWTFKTSGVSGNIKTVYRDIGTIVGYPEEMDKTIRNHITVFLHSKRRIGESYYITHDFNHKKMYPRGIFLEYENREQLLEYAQRGEVLFIIEYPLMTEWICYQLETAIESGTILPKNIAKKKVYLELSGEPVTEYQIQSIVKRLQKIFQCDVDYFVTYGLNEFGHVGTYIPELHGPKIVYEVVPSLFVEEVNEEIIITSFRTSGTILFRYRTYDKGKLLFRNDRPFLSDIRKSEDEGFLYAAGAKINVPSILENIKKLVGGPVGIEFFKREYSKSGKCELELIIHGDIRGEKVLDLSAEVKRLIMESAILDVEDYLGIVDIRINFSTAPLKKSWFISTSRIDG